MDNKVVVFLWEIKDTVQHLTYIPISSDLAGQQKESEISFSPDVSIVRNPIFRRIITVVTVLKEKVFVDFTIVLPTAVE